MIQHAKNQVIQSVRSPVTLSFRIPSLDWPDPFLKVNFRVNRPYQPHLFLPMHNQKIFDQLLIFVNLYQHAQNETVSALFSVVMTDLKILQSEWLTEHFGIFSQIKDCAETQQIIKIFIIEQVQGKLMTIVLFTFKKNLFLARFLNFGGQKSFPKKSSSVRHNLIKVSSTMSEFRES